MDRGGVSGAAGVFPGLERRLKYHTVCGGVRRSKQALIGVLREASQVVVRSQASVLPELEVLVV